MTDSSTPNIPPGFYPDGNGATRYWDGQGWTMQVRDEPPTETLEAEADLQGGVESFHADPEHDDPRPWFKKKRIMIPLVGLGLFVFMLIVIPTSPDDKKSDTTAAQAADSKKADAAKERKSAEKEETSAANEQERIAAKKRAQADQTAKKDQADRWERRAAAEAAKFMADSRDQPWGVSITGVDMPEPGRLVIETSIVDPRGASGSPQALEAIGVCEGAVAALSKAGVEDQYVAVMERDGTHFVLFGHPSYPGACREV